MVISAELTDTLFEMVSDYEDIRPSIYSGRGMYGKVCIGFTGNPNELMDFFEDVAVRCAEYDNDNDIEWEDSLLNEWRKVRRSRSSDSMGYDTIIYFSNAEPSEKFNEYCEDRDEEEDY